MMDCHLEFFWYQWYQFIQSEYLCRLYIFPAQASVRSKENAVVIHEWTTQTLARAIGSSTHVLASPWPCPLGRGGCFIKFYTVMYIDILYYYIHILSTRNPCTPYEERVA